jgi:hypothetical protein
MGSLLLPPAIASVRYAAGCRFGRIKVKALAAGYRRLPNAPVIILSKRLLEQVRPAAATPSDPRSTAA